MHFLLSKYYDHIDILKFHLCLSWLKKRQFGCSNKKNTKIVPILHVCKKNQAKLQGSFHNKADFCHFSLRVWKIRARISPWTSSDQITFDTSHFWVDTINQDLIWYYRLGHYTTIIFLEVQQKQNNFENQFFWKSVFEKCLVHSSPSVDHTASAVMPILNVFLLQPST